MTLTFLLALAQEEFEDAMRDSHNLVEIHRDLRTGRGRRTREMALNRAIVVFTVAAWQAYAQDAVKAAVKDMRPSKGEPQGSYSVLRAMALKAVDTFGTPNAENTRALMLHVGFDPWPSWQWKEGPVTLSELQVRERLNQWLKVRHAIAHGDDLPDVPILSKTGSGAPTLWMRNAEMCIRFFERLTEVNTAGLARVLPDPEAERQRFRRAIARELQPRI